MDFYNSVFDVWILVNEIVSFFVWVFMWLFLTKGKKDQTLVLAKIVIFKYRRVISKFTWVQISKQEL